MSEVNNDFLEYGASFLVTKRDYDLYFSDPFDYLVREGNALLHQAIKWINCLL